MAVHFLAQNAGFAGAIWFPSAVTGVTTMEIPSFRWPVTMRVAPTVVTYNPAAANAEVRNATALQDCSATGAANTSTENTRGDNLVQSHTFQSTEEFLYFLRIGGRQRRLQDGADVGFDVLRIAGAEQHPLAPDSCRA